MTSNMKVDLWFEELCIRKIECLDSLSVRNNLETEIPLEPSLR